MAIWKSWPSLRQVRIHNKLQGRTDVERSGKWKADVKMQSRSRQTGDSHSFMFSNLVPLGFTGWLDLCGVFGDDLSVLDMISIDKLRSHFNIKIRASWEMDFTYCMYVEVALFNYFRPLLWAFRSPQSLNKLQYSISFDLWLVSRSLYTHNKIWRIICFCSCLHWPSMWITSIDTDVHSWSASVCRH